MTFKASITEQHSRRSLLALAGLSGAAAVLPASSQAANTADATRAAKEAAAGSPSVAMMIYPGMVMLDLVGPMSVFRILQWDINLVWKDKQPVATDLGIPLSATRDFSECPPHVDILFVPGGIMGTIAAMNDPEVVSFVASRGSQADWVTGVCTGSLILAAAGLLKGYDATSHWSVADLLPLMGARHVDARVVVDRNRMTGGGVTAGIDFGLTLAVKVEGEDAAKRAALIMEYAPAPPFRAGTPGEAGVAVLESLGPQKSAIDQAALVASRAAAKRLNL